MKPAATRGEATRCRVLDGHEDVSLEVEKLSIGPKTCLQIAGTFDSSKVFCSVVLTVACEACGNGKSSAAPKHRGGRAFVVLWSVEPAGLVASG